MWMNVAQFSFYWHNSSCFRSKCALSSFKHSISTRWWRCHPEHLCSYPQAIALTDWEICYIKNLTADRQSSNYHTVQAVLPTSTGRTCFPCRIPLGMLEAHDIKTQTFHLDKGKGKLRPVFDRVPDGVSWLPFRCLSLILRRLFHA